MFKLLSTILITITFVVAGCSSDNNKEINSGTLRHLVSKAMTGDAEANEKLKGLLTNQHIKKTDNNLTIDSLTLKGTKYYSLLLEYSDPKLNRFAVYDDKLNLYILDKSLNGYLSDKWIQMGTHNFCFVQERFLSKDILSLDRLSIYELKDGSVNLIYRSLSRYADDKGTSSQTVESMTPKFIVTKMTSLLDKALNNQPDTFYYNTNAKEYLSKLNLFNNYVKQQVKEFSIIPIKPQIPSDMLENYNSKEK